jgi:hypothetical protein
MVHTLGLYFQRHYFADPFLDQVREAIITWMGGAEPMVALGPFQPTMLPPNEAMAGVHLLVAVLVLTQERPGHVVVICESDRWTQRWLRTMHRYLDTFKDAPQWAWTTITENRSEFVELRNVHGVVTRVSVFSVHDATNLRGAGAHAAMLILHALPGYVPNRLALLLPLMNAAAMTLDMAGITRARAD